MEPKNYSTIRNILKQEQDEKIAPYIFKWAYIQGYFNIKERSVLANYDAFCKLWYQLTPYIQIMSSQTDLCDICQQLWNNLQFNAHKKEEAQDLLKKYKKLLSKAKLERNYYNKNTKLAEEHKKLVEQNFSLAKDKNVYVPHSDQQIGKVYYFSACKVHLFGIQDEAVCEQINYMLDKNELFGKDSNGTFSLVFNGIKQLNKGEKHLKITCDNAGGQKQCHYLVLLVFVDCIDHIIDIVKKSNITKLNKTDNPDVVQAQEVANGPFQEFKLLKFCKLEALKIIQKTKTLSFPVPSFNET
ncbi:hypothetical protein G9A89_019164 [Geosiphon pyriformis]|nr:hypothetical protein G9A89_019164 [Geosiphon pyriformis]